MCQNFVIFFEKCITEIKIIGIFVLVFGMFDDLRNLNNESYGYGHKEITWWGASRCGTS